MNPPASAAMESATQAAKRQDHELRLFEGSDFDAITALERDHRAALSNPMDFK